MGVTIMNNTLPKVAAIHDISGIGRCSLSVITPILSVMGVQACPIPTAILSSHTGGFGDVAFHDLSVFIEESLDHYKRLEFDFDCIYTGFLASEQQIDSCIKYFSHYKNSFAVVDPVMGDHGKPYKTYTKNMIARMGELVNVADVITPNITEAGMLLGSPISTPLTRMEAKSILARLSEKGPRYVLITGVPMITDEIYNIGYDCEKGTYWYVKCCYVPVSYPGTGDIFTSILTGGLLRGDSLPISMERSTRFLELAINTTYSYGTDSREGVMFEKSLAWLTENRMFSGFENL